MRKIQFTSLRMLLLMQVCIAVLPVLVLTVYLGLSQMRLARSVAQERAVRVATQAASIQRWMVEAGRRQLRAISEVEVLLDPDESKRSAFFAEQQRGRILISNLGMADITGQVLNSSGSSGRAVSLANEEWFQRVLKTHKPAEGKYQLSPVTGQPLLPLAAPVFDDKEQLHAVVFAGLNLSWLQELASDAELPKDGALFMLGTDGQLLLKYPGEGRLPGEVTRWARYLREADTWLLGNEFYGCAPMLLGDKTVLGRIVVQFPSAALYQQLRRNIIIQVGALLLVAELMMLMLIIGGRRFLVRPINKLSEVTKQFAAGDLGVRVERLHGAAELEELGESFNQMAEALRQQNRIVELSEERFRQVVEASPVGIHFWHLSADGQLLLTGFNPAAVDILGMDHEPLLGKPLQEAFPFYAGTDVPDRYREVCVVGTPWHWEEVQSTNDRVHRAFEVTAFRTSPGNMVVLFSDVSERRQALEALRESERRFRQFFENSPDAVFVETSDGIVIDVNNAACSLHGLSREQLVGKHVTDLVPAERREQVLRDFPRVASGEWTNFESFSYTGSGHAIPVEISAALIDYSGSPSILLHVRDISSRKQAQVALLESEARFRNLSEATFEGVALSDNGRILDANTRLIEMTGYRLTEMIGRPLADIAIPEFRQTLAEHLATTSSKPIEYTALRKDGTTFPAEARSRTLPYKGKLVRVTAMRDMTEQKRTHETMQRLVAAVEQTVEGILVTDPNGVILYVNPAFETITGYTRDEVIGTTPRFLKSGKHDDAFYRELWETITRGDVWRGFFFNRKKDGTIFQEEDTITPIKDAQGRITSFVAVKRDVTREVTLELQLLQSQKMEAVGRLAGGVAHDFNNILTAITGYGELSLRKLQPTDTLHRHVQEILKAAGRATTLTRQLLAFSRKQVLEPHIFELNELIINLQGMLHRLIGENVELITDLEPGAPWPIKSNPGQMEQVIVNMVVNARDAMPDGGKLTLRTRNVTVEKEFTELHVGVPTGDCVLLSVTDTGTGMSEETKAHIFEPFFTTKGRDKGTGLGLATCYGIVKQAEGHIVVTSKPGEGTTFDIYIPRANAGISSAPTAVAVGAAEEVPRSRGNEIVLLVEDEEAVRELTRMIMTELGYDVWVAVNGVDALRLIHEKLPRKMDILFTDVVMPQMGGRELAERLRAADSNLKVIFCTGYTAEADWINSILSPITQFIQKPFTPIKLGRTLREVLDAKPNP